MSEYCNQGSRMRDLGGGIKAPAQDRGGASVLEEAKKGTTGIITDKGIGKDGKPIK